MANIVVFASGSGTNFQALIDAVESGQIQATIKGLISNRSDNQALARADSHNIEARVIRPSQFKSKQKYTTEVLNQLHDWDTDLIVLAGYMIKIPDALIKKYENRIVNIHPSLLPKYGGKGFYGEKVHQAVIDNKESESGCTVHLVTKKYDQGPILAQRKVPVKADDDADSLSKRILKEEHKLLPVVVGRLAEQLNSKSNN